MNNFKVLTAAKWRPLSFQVASIHHSVLFCTFLKSSVYVLLLGSWVRLCFLPFPHECLLRRVSLPRPTRKVRGRRRDRKAWRLVQRQGRSAWQQLRDSALQTRCINHVAILPAGHAALPGGKRAYRRATEYVWYIVYTDRQTDRQRTL